GGPLRRGPGAGLVAGLLLRAPAPLRFARLAALAADLLVEGVPVLVANGLPALAARLAHRYGTLLLHHLIRHSPPLPFNAPSSGGKCEKRRSFLDAPFLGVAPPRRAALLG